MKADGLYRYLTIDSDGSLYLAEDVLDGLEAAQHLAMEHVIHVLAGWSVARCRCGLGIICSKDGVTRGAHLLPLDEEQETTEVESIALAVGLLAPQSHHAGLQAVAS